MSEIFRNKITITAVHNRRGKQFAFAVLHEPEPRMVFLPYWIIKAFEITTLDQGCEFDCLFVDQPEDRHPVVLAILDENIKLEPSQIVGSFEGRPGTEDFTAIVNILNRKPSCSPHNS